MNKSRACAIAVAAVTLLSTAVHARQQSYAQSAPTGLALEIIYLKGQPPSLYPVASPQAKQSGGWSSRFGRVAGWQLPDGTLPVRAVQVVSRLEGEGGLAKIWVSVLLGQELIEREEPVTTYEIGENKKVVVTELTRFGVEPIEIKVVRVAPYITILPLVVGQAPSVLVTGITAKTSTLPSYQLSLQNLSSKNVVALEWYIVIGGKKQIVALPQGAEGRPLIPAGGHYELTVSGAYQIRPTYGGHPPDLTQGHDWVIGAVVFSDGSYEGEPESAAGLRAQFRGRKVQIPKVVALLQGALNSAEPDASATLRRLKDELSALKTDVDVSEMDALLGEFPALPPAAQARLVSAVRVALQGIKKAAIDEVDNFEKAKGTALDKSALRSWLLATKEKYEQWLSRL